MTVYFKSKDRASRTAKAIMASLASSGIDRRYTAVREAAARAFGYRSWNDLLTGSSSGHPHPDDPTASAAWVVAAGVVLARELSIPTTPATSAIESIIPLLLPRAGWTWHRAAAAISHAIDALSASVEPIERSGLKGFEAVFPGERHDFVLLLCVSDDGKDIIAKRAKRAHPGDFNVDGAEYERGFGSLLHEFGLFHGTDRESDGLAMQTLSRLDGRVMGALRFVDRFEAGAYRLALSLPEDGAFMRSTADCPSLIGIVSWLSMCRDSMRIEGMSDTEAMLEEIIGSTDPIETLVDHAIRVGREQHPQHPVDRDAARTVVRSLGSHRVPRSEQHLAPWNVAHLSFCPARMLPSADKDTRTIEDLVGFVGSCLEAGISPTNLYAELFQHDSARWEDVLKQAHLSVTTFSQASKDIADLVLTKLAQELRVPILLGYGTEESLGLLRRGVLRCMTQDAGPIAIAERIERWREQARVNFLDEHVAEEFALLRASKVIGAPSSSLTAGEMVDMIDPRIRAAFRTETKGPQWYL